MGSTYSKHQAENSVAGTAVLTKGSRVSGELTIRGDIHLDGHIEGKVRSSGYIVVGKNGLVKGTVISNKIYVSGEVEGDIFANYVEIYESGKVSGSIKTEILVMEKGGLLNGKSR